MKFRFKNAVVASLPKTTSGENAARAITPNRSFHCSANYKVNFYTTPEDKRRGIKPKRTQRRRMCRPWRNNVPLTKMERGLQA